MKGCPQCGQEVADDAKMCPNCGRELSTVWPPPPGFSIPPGAYPPPPSGTEVALGVVPRWLSASYRGGSRRRTEVALGVVLGILFFPVFVPLIAWALGSIPFLRNSFALWYVEAAAAVGLALGLYFGTRRRFRAFARSFGWTVLGASATLLGALAVCYAIIRGV